jgi:peptide/nickel transport system ATP-binding protein
MNALNPTMTIFNQIADAFWTHGDSDERGTSLRSRVDALLGTVGLSGRVGPMYPHELSGGMKQRVCIAMAIALRPRLIVADEPTSALDVIVQRVVAQTLVRVVEGLGASLMLIGHDMGLQAQLVDRLAVMYAGKIVEIGPVAEMFAEPLHPYTRLLIGSLPSLRARHALKGIPGLPPALLTPLTNCRFAPRCPLAIEVCQREEPPLREVAPGRWVACHLC